MHRFLGKQLYGRYIEENTTKFSHILIVLLVLYLYFPLVSRDENRIKGKIFSHNAKVSQLHQKRGKNDVLTLNLSVIMLRIRATIVEKFQRKSIR